MFHYRSGSSLCFKCASGRYSDDNKVYKHSKEPEKVQLLKSVSTTFNAVFYLCNYHLKKRFEQYNIHIFGKIAKFRKRMDVQRQFASCNPSDLILVLFFLQSSTTVRNCSSIPEYSGMKFGDVIISTFIRRPAKAAISHNVTADNETDHKQEGKIISCYQVITYLYKTDEIDRITTKAETDI